MYNNISPDKASSVELEKNGLFVGTVTRVEDKSVYVEIPQLTPGFSYGPCLVVANNLQIQLTRATAVTSTVETFGPAVVSVSGGGMTPVTSTTQQFVKTVTDNTNEFVVLVDIELVPPPEGSLVLCGFLNNSLDEIIVLGSILS
jgi:hypothetical protein